MASLIQRLFASDYTPGSKPGWYFWYPTGTSASDKKLLFKLDSTILVFGCLSFWVKYLDQTNLTNAYVTGMKESLNIQSNEYTTMITMFTVGTAIAQIPSNLILTRVPARLWLSGCEFVWGILTLALYKVNSPQQIYALRFFIGFLEGSCFVGMQYMFGTWYTRRELGKRTAIFACCAYAGSMFSGFIQAGIQRNLHMTHGLEGWRWLFIIDAIITFAVAIFGFVMFPDTPTTTKAWYLTPEEKARCVERLVEDGRADEVNAINLAMFKRIFTTWQFWVLVPVWIGWSNTCGKYGGTIFSLWMKSDKRWSVYDVNNIPTSLSGMNIVAILVTAWLVDITGRRLLVIFGCFAIQLLGTILLLVWNIPMGLHFFAILTAANDGPTSPIIMSWANILLSGDSQRRAVVIASMNTFGSAVSSIVNQYGYDTRTAPRFQKGIALSLAFVLLLFVGTAIIRYIEITKVADERAARQAEESDSGGVASIEDEKEKDIKGGVVAAAII